MQRICAGSVSTHALRGEGDKVKTVRSCNAGKFQSTPSARRATIAAGLKAVFLGISIHALRGESDPWLLPLRSSTHNFNPRPPRGGRPQSSTMKAANTDFNPRPPRGGRQHGAGFIVRLSGFQSTPSARRATGLHCGAGKQTAISIHALREEGDPVIQDCNFGVKRFQSTPSARRATSTLWSRHICPTYFNPRPPRGGRRPGSAAPGIPG